MVRPIKSGAFISRDTIDKKIFKDFIVEDARIFSSQGTPSERSVAKKKFLKKFVALFKKTYNRAPGITEIENITRSGHKIINKHLVQGKDFLTHTESLKLALTDPALKESRLKTRMSKPVKELSFMALGTKRGETTILPRFVDKAQENAYKKLLKEKYSVPKGRSPISNEDITKKFFNTKNPTKNQIDKIKLINSALKKELNLEYPKQTYEGEALLKKEQRARRAEAIKVVSSPAKERELVKAKQFSGLDLAHRSSLEQNRKLGLKYMASDLGLDPSKLNQEILIPTEQKLESLYKKQINLRNKGQKFFLDKNKKIPSTLSTAIEDINKKISDTVYSTDGRLSGILIDEKTLEPTKIGKDYSKVLGMGLEDKAVKDLTRTDLDLIKANLPNQIEQEQKLAKLINEGNPKIKKALEARVGCAEGCLVKVANEEPGKITRALKSIKNFFVPKPEMPSIKYDDTLGAFVNPATDDVVSQAELKTWADEHPMEVKVGEAKPGILRKTGRALAHIGLPLPTAALDAYFVGRQIKEGKSPTEIAKDPFNWLGLATMEPLTKAAGMTEKSGKLASALRLGMSPGMIRGATRFLGLPGLALSTGLTAYDQYQKYKNKEGFIYDLFNREEIDNAQV